MIGPDHPMQRGNAMYSARQVSPSFRGADWMNRGPGQGFGQGYMGGDGEQHGAHRQFNGRRFGLRDWFANWRDRMGGWQDWGNSGGEQAPQPAPYAADYFNPNQANPLGRNNLPGGMTINSMLTRQPTI